MTQEQKAGRATPASTLEQHIMDSNIAKSEAEWWARTELTTLRAEVKRLNRDIEMNLEHDVERAMVVLDSREAMDALQFPVIVESYRRKNDGKGKRAYLKEFTEKEGKA